MKTIAQIRANWKTSLACAAFGSIFTIFGMIFSPLNAQQSNEIAVDKITCEELSIVNNFGMEVARLFSTTLGEPRLYLLGKASILVQDDLMVGSGLQLSDKKIVRIKFGQKTNLTPE